MILVTYILKLLLKFLVLITKTLHLAQFKNSPHNKGIMEQSINSKTIRKNMKAKTLKDYRFKGILVYSWKF